MDMKIEKKKIKIENHYHAYFRDNKGFTKDFEIKEYRPTFDFAIEGIIAPDYLEDFQSIPVSVGIRKVTFEYWERELLREEVEETEKLKTIHKYWKLFYRES